MRHLPAPALHPFAIGLFSLFFWVAPVFITFAADPAPLVLAPISEIPDNQIEIFTPLRDYLEKRLKRPVRLLFTQSYEDLLNRFGQGKVDIVFGGPYTFALARERYNAKPLVMRKLDGKTDYQVYIFVREESGMTDLKQLEGKRFAFTDMLSTSGYLVPRAMMAEGGISDPNTFFSEIKFKKNYTDIIESVILGEVDGAATASFQFEGFGLRNRSLRVIKKSPPLTLGPVFANPKTLSGAEIEAIRQAFLAIGKSLESANVVKALGTPEFTEVAEDAYRWVDDYQRILATLPPVQPLPAGWLLPDVPTFPLSGGFRIGKLVATLFAILGLYVLFNFWHKRDRLLKGLAIRLFFAFFALILLAVLLMGSLIYFPVKEGLARNAGEARHLFTQTVLLSAREAILHEDKAYLKRYSDSLIRQHRIDLTHVAFYGKEEALLAAAGRMPTEEKGRSLSTVSLPVMLADQQEGRVEIGFSHERTTRAWKETLITMLLIALLTTLIAIVVALKDTLRITQPLADLTAHTKIIAAGNLDQKMPIVSNDEIGQLADAFNGMMEKLKNTIFREKKLEDISLVLAEVSHRFKNTVAGINNYAFLLQQQLPHNAPGRVEVDQIRVKTKQLDNIIGMFLLPETSFKSVDLLEILNKAVANADSRARENGIEIIIRYDLPRLEIRGDAERLAWVFDNLISNATEALIEKKEGARSVQIVLCKRGEKVIVEVEDNGNGIPEEILSRIFNPFFSTKHERGGTGLGLFIAYLTVKQHGGRIDVERRKEEGSRFIVEFPIRSEEE